MIAVLLLAACLPLSRASAADGCTVVATGANDWFCQYTATGPSTYTAASVSGWEIRRLVSGDKWETLASDRTGMTGPGGFASDIIPTKQGDYVQLIVWRVFVPVFNPATRQYIVYQDGYLTAASN